MTALSRKILDEYQVRKTKKQKTAFIDLMKANFPEITVQEGGFPKCRNLIAGDVEKAKVILTAHYDTCAQLPVPNFITPKNFLFTALYSLLIVLPVVLAIYLVNVLVGMYTVDFTFHYAASLVIYLAFMLVLLAGPANKHTANDNTSGVVTVLETARALPEHLREQVCFVLFDLEEAGLVGSSSYAKKHRKAAKYQIVLNCDCCGDGDELVLFPMKKIKKDGAKMDAFRAVCIKDGEKSLTIREKGFAYYPSDQKHFPYGVGIAAFRRSKWAGLYCDKIHTKKDTILDENNVSFLRDRLIALISAAA